jgi:hypothetical protein
MLLFIAPTGDSQSKEGLDANSKRKREFDSIITDQFY